MIVLRLLAVVCAVVLTCIVTAATDLHAFSVMGCNFNFGENHEGCINGKINEQINQEKTMPTGRLTTPTRKPRTPSARPAHSPRSSIPCRKKPSSFWLNRM